MLEINKIYCGDCLEIMKEIPDESIDLILTDPPYTKETIYLYEKLAIESKRLLKEGGYLFAYSGAEFLPYIISSINQYLDWFWIFEIQHKGSQPRFWSKKIMVGCKPVVIFTKGKPKKVEWLCNLHTLEHIDKRFHKWGQSIGFGLKIIDTLTNENDLVLDPFLGGGTTAIACLQTNRNYIGIEISQEYVDIANKRINDYKQQLKMEF